MMGQWYPGMLQRCRLPVLGTITVGFLLLYLIALAPHLVHHIGDGNGGRSACPHLAQSQQAPVVHAEPPALAPPELAETLKVVLPETLALPSPGAPFPSRAPPHTSGRA